MSARELLKDYMVREHGENVEDIVNHGIDSGFGEFIYTSDINAFYNKFRRELWECLSDMADEQGEASALILLATFGGAGNVCDEDGIKQLVVWGVVESVCYELVECDGFRYSEEDEDEDEENEEQED